MYLMPNGEKSNFGEPIKVNIPSIWINRYIQESIALNFGIGVPIFPTLPSSLDDIEESWGITINKKLYPYSGIILTYDRMFKNSGKIFPHIKEDQVMLYAYAVSENAADLVFGINELLLRLLDNGDESAQDLNKWSKGKTIDINGSSKVNEFYFHSSRIYQLEETRDLMAYGSVKTFGMTKIIIDYKYHRVN